MNANTDIQYGVTERGSNWLFFTVIIVQIIVGIIVNVTVSITNKDIPMNLLLLCTQIFAVFIPCYVYMKYKHVNVIKTLRLRPLKLKYAFLSLLLGIATQYIAQIFNLPILILLSLFGEIPPMPIEIPNNVHDLLITLGIVAIVPAVFEEIMVRGIIMSSYEKRGTKVGIIISAVFFGLLHMDIKNLFGPIVFGIVFGYIVIRTDSIFAGMIAHFANNGFAILISFFYENYMEPISFMDTYLFVLVLFTVSSLLFIFIIGYFRNHAELKETSMTEVHTGRLRNAFINFPVLSIIILYIIFAVFEIVTIANGKV